MRRRRLLHPAAAWLAPLVVWTTALGIAGCETPTRQATLDAAAYPPDFTLVFFVEADGSDGPADLPEQRPAQHVVTPDRLLRAALGPGVTPRFHPPATATLTAGQMAELYRLAEAAAQAEAGLPPISRAARPAVVYVLTLTASGTSADLRTTPDRNPAARDLLDLLIQLRGGR